MDHNNPAVKQEKQCGQCPHGKCLNHSPEWKKVDVARMMPNPLRTWFIFFTTEDTYEDSACCKRMMARYKKVQRWQCKRCGRTEDEVLNHHVALCLCCGRTEDKTPPPEI